MREHGVIKDARVQSFEAKSASDAGVTGLHGEHVRLRLTYDIMETNAPQSMFAKFSAADPDLRAHSQRNRHYDKEVRFYEQAAAQVELRTPRCYYSTLNDETGVCVLLLEDLAPARGGELAVGCTPAQAKLAVEAIAKFHATWWESPQLDELKWLPEIGKIDVQAGQVGAQRAWQSLLEKVGHRLPQSLLDLGARFTKDISVLYNSYREVAQTFIHGDYQPENIFFATEQGGVPLAVIDWQITYRGPGALDVAYFMVMGLQPIDRKTREMDLLHSYHRILLENGVQGYSFDQCLMDYRLNTLRPLNIFIIVMGLGLFEGDKLTTFFDAMMPRLDAALTDLNVAEFLPE